MFIKKKKKTLKHAGGRGQTTVREDAISENTKITEQTTIL